MMQEAKIVSKSKLHPSLHLVEMFKTNYADFYYILAEFMWNF